MVAAGRREYKPSLNPTKVPRPKAEKSTSTGCGHDLCSPRPGLRVQHQLRGRGRFRISEFTVWVLGFRGFMAYGAWWCGLACSRGILAQVGVLAILPCRGLRSARRPAESFESFSDSSRNNPKLRNLQSEGRNPECIPLSR